MEIIFTQGAGKYDEMRVVRDGTQETIPCPKQRIIPHDMVHYAVESCLKKRGFLARVGEGAPASFRMEAEPESDGVERLVEVVQGDAWSGSDASAADMLDLYRVTCSARECPPLRVGVEEIDAIRRTVQELDARWQALAVGESMSLVI